MPRRPRDPRIAFLDERQQLACPLAWILRESIVSDPEIRRWSKEFPQAVFAREERLEPYAGELALMVAIVRVEKPPIRLVQHLFPLN